MRRTPGSRWSLAAPRVALAALGALAAAASACAEPAIEMSLRLPAAERAAAFNVSCVGAVEVFVRGEERGAFPTGPNDPGRPADDLVECVEVKDVTSFAQIRSAIAGRFQIDLPESGLLGVEIRGSTGTCNKDIAPGDTIFYGSAEYRGGDLVIPVTPNLSCNTTKAETVRPVDLIELTRTGTCPVALPDNAGGVDSATIHPGLLGPYLDFNNDFAAVTGGVATLPLYTSSDNDSCVALNYWDRGEVMISASCVRRGTGVCAAAGQIELPIVSADIAYGSSDVALVEKHGGSVIGAVWGTDATNTKVKLAGATVTPASSAKATVVYADYTAGAARLTSLPSAAATTASGLFIAYVGEPVDFVVKAPGYREERIRMASPDLPGTALVMLSKQAP
jgi:hypothetical protein